MNSGFTYRRLCGTLLSKWHSRALWLKAAVFGLIGVVNTIVDFGVFFLTRLSFDRSPTTLLMFNSAADFCHCGTASSIGLVAANAVAWIVAVTTSYIMNSFVTFAHETDRRLTWYAYTTFAVSGIAGWFASTAVLLFAANVILLPVWLAKLTALLASFVANFSILHLVVFRKHIGPSTTKTDY